MRRSSRALVPVAALCLLASMLLTGCSSPDEAPDDEEKNASAAQATPLPEALPGGFVALSKESGSEEYLDAIADIDNPLPEGVDYPDGLPADFFASDGLLQEGAGRNQAWFTWLCAWEGEYLDALADGDVQRLAESESMIAAWAEMPFYRDVVDDSSGGWVSNVVEPMRRGDPDGVKFEHRSMCPAYPAVAAR